MTRYHTQHVQLNSVTLLTVIIPTLDLILFYVMILNIRMFIYRNNGVNYYLIIFIDDTYTYDAFYEQMN